MGVKWCPYKNGKFRARHAHRDNTPLRRVMLPVTKELAERPGTDCPPEFCLSSI